MNNIKIFSLPWHVSHQYELLKMNPENGYPFEWNYLVQHTRTWGEQARPEPKHLKWVPYYEEGKYDLAILHVDQQCLSTTLGKSRVFREIKKQIHDIPIIVVNHGTPIYPELFMQMCGIDGYKQSEEGAMQWAKDKMKKLLEGIDEMVVNSHEAEAQWGWGKTIIHGLDPSEWWNLRKDPRVAIFISPAGIGNKYYGRKLFEETRCILKEKYGVELVWIGQDKYCKDFDDYRNFIGKTLVYFNPTMGSPMPRTRTEAMMSGCCLVTTGYQDADKFIQDGVNGWICKNNPEHAAKLIADMIFDYKTAVKIGNAGRETAIELFNGKRFRSDWVNLISKVLDKKIKVEEK